VASVVATNRWNLTTAATFQYPGWRQPVDVARPADVPVAIGRIQTSDGRETWRSMLVVSPCHCCTLCIDGAWR
jgi:hypothetical protein